MDRHFRKASWLCPRRGSRRGASIFCLGLGIALIASAARGQDLEFIQQEKDVIGTHPFSVSCIAFTKDGKMFASSGGVTVIVWNADKMKEITTLKGFRHGVGWVAFSPDGKTLATTGFEEPARLYDTATWKLRHKLTELSRGTRMVAFSPDGKVLATVEHTDYVCLWDPMTGKQLDAFHLGIEHLARIAFSPDGKMLAGAGYRIAVLYDLHSRKVRATLDGHKSMIRSLEFSADGKRLVTADVGRVTVEAGLERKAFLWDGATGKRMLELDMSKTTIGHVYAATFLRDSKSVALAGMSPYVHAFDVASGRQWHVFKSVNVGYDALAFAPNGKMLLTGCEDGTIKVWDVPDHAKGMKAAEEAEKMRAMDRLVAQLGMGSGLEREEAARALIRLGKEALVSLKKGMGMALENQEVARRCSILTHHLTSKRDDKSIRELVARVAPHGIDVLVEKLVRKGEQANEADWETVIKLAQAARKQSETLGVEKFDAPDYLSYPALFGRAFTMTRPISRNRVLAELVATEWQAGNCVIVAAGPVHIQHQLGDAIVFANGPVSIGGFVRNSVIICDGKVELGARAINSVILARGPAQLGTFNQYSAIEWNEPNPLGVFSFFDPAQLGIEVALAKNQIRVESVHAEKAFARAGLRAGDIIVALDKSSVQTLEEFRNLLRRKLLDGATALSIRRDDKDLQISVKFLN